VRRYYDDPMIMSICRKSYDELTILLNYDKVTITNFRSSETSLCQQQIQFTCRRCVSSLSDKEMYTRDDKRAYLIGVYGHFEPKTFRHWCRSVHWTLRHHLHFVYRSFTL